MSHADTRAAWHLIDLWRDGISYHVDPVDVLRLHEIATAVIGRARTEGVGQIGDVAEAAIGQERARWLEWLAEIGYGNDFTSDPHPPCTPRELAEVLNERESMDADADGGLTGVDLWVWCIAENTGWETCGNCGSDPKTCDCDES